MLSDIAKVTLLPPSGSRDSGATPPCGHQTHLLILQQQQHQLAGVPLEASGLSLQGMAVLEVLGPCQMALWVSVYVTGRLGWH